MDINCAQKVLDKLIRNNRVRVEDVSIKEEEMCKGSYVILSHWEVDITGYTTELKCNYSSSTDTYYVRGIGITK